MKRIEAQKRLERIRRKQDIRSMWWLVKRIFLIELIGFAAIFATIILLNQRIL